MRELIEKYGGELCGEPGFFMGEALRGHVEERRASNLTNLVKALHVLEYLGQLRKEGLDPLFKGGSAVQLLLPEGWQRLSIDLDLTIDISKNEVGEALKRIHERFGREYYPYESREGEFESDVPFYNYRIAVPTFGGEATILLDILGVDVGRILKKIKSDGRFKSIPVAMFTVVAEERAAGMFGCAGYDAYIEKPFEREKMLATVQALLTPEKAVA